MVSRQTKHKIADVLESIAEGEIKVEVLRLVLAEKYAFEPYTAFKRIALAPSSYLTRTDLQEFLFDNGISISSNEARHLVNIFDLDKDGVLSYSEFLNIVLPRTDSVLRKRVTLREAYHLRDDERLPYDVEYALARILEEELKAFERTESLKRLLSLSYEYTLGRTFNALDYDVKDYIIFDDLADFSDELGRPLDNKQIDAIIRRLDVDLDGRISYNEFVDAFSYPKSDIAIPSSPRRIATSPRHSRNRSADLRHSYVSPLKSENKNLEYRDYLSESRRRSLSPRRSASPRRSKIEEEYRTPIKSTHKHEDEHVYSSRKKSPLRVYEEDELARSFKEMINSSRLLESSKNDLALRFDFNLYDAFRYFDFYGAGAYISAKQFEEGLADLKIFPTKDQVSLFFKRFDSDYDGFLRFTDFSNLLTPKSLEYAKILEHRKPRYVEADEPIFTRETERLLAKVLNLALENEVQAESIRQRLSRRPLFNLFDAFRAIDKYEQGFILIEDLKEILASHGIFTSNNDAHLLLDQFKGGDKHNGKISYSEFVKQLSPKSSRIY